MKQALVMIGGILWTRVSGVKVKVMILGVNESAVSRGSRARRTKFRCLSEATNREILRSAAALHESDNFND